MRQSLRYASWLLLLFILLSCSHRVTGEATALPPILQAEAQSQKYNLQLDFMKHHFSGMLIVRQMPDNEIRILGSTYFGLSLFDFSLHRDTFIVNSCMEPMRKKKMLKILDPLSGYWLIYYSIIVHFSSRGIIKNSGQISA